MPISTRLIGSQSPVYSTTRGVLSFVVPKSYNVNFCEYWTTSGIVNNLVTGGWTIIGRGPDITWAWAGNGYSIPPLPIPPEVMALHNLPSGSMENLNHSQGWILQNKAGFTIWIRVIQELFGLGAICPDVRVLGDDNSYFDCLQIAPGAGSYGDSDHPFETGVFSTFIANPLNFACSRTDGTWGFFLGTPIGFGSTSAAYDMADEFDYFFQTGDHVGIVKDGIAQYSGVETPWPWYPTARGPVAWWGLCEYYSLGKYALKTHDGRPVSVAPLIQNNRNDAYGCNGIGLDCVAITKLRSFDAPQIIDGHTHVCLAGSTPADPFACIYSIWHSID